MDFRAERCNQQEESPASLARLCFKVCTTKTAKVPDCEAHNELIMAPGREAGVKTDDAGSSVMLQMQEEGQICWRISCISSPGLKAEDRSCPQLHAAWLQALQDREGNCSAKLQLTAGGLDLTHKSWR